MPDCPNNKRTHTHTPSRISLPSQTGEDVWDRRLAPFRALTVNHADDVLQHAITTVTFKVGAHWTGLATASSGTTAAGDLAALPYRDVQGTLQALENPKVAAPPCSRHGVS